MISTRFKPKDRVRNGSQLLRTVEPGWYRRIDPKNLNLRDHANCVLSQVFGSYSHGVESLGLTHFYGGTTDGFINGFDRGFDDTEEDFVKLHDAWVGTVERLLRENPRERVV